LRPILKPWTLHVHYLYKLGSMKFVLYQLETDFRTLKLFPFLLIRRF
jgi:hypothetical protein